MTTNPQNHETLVFLNKTHKESSAGCGYQRTGIHIRTSSLCCHLLVNMTDRETDMACLHGAFVVKVLRTVHTLRI